MNKNKAIIKHNSIIYVLLWVLRISESLIHGKLLKYSSNLPVNNIQVIKIIIDYNYKQIDYEMNTKLLSSIIHLKHYYLKQT